MISVAMTTCNGEKYILEQLNSIINQTMKPDEVIISDDCSTDNTIELINDFINSNNLKDTWKLIKNDTQKGFIKNFIETIILTHGDIIFLADQDDVFLEKKFETMTLFMKENKDCTVLNANYDFICDQNSNYRLSIPKRKNGEKISFKHLLYNSNYPGFSMAFKKEIIDKLNRIDLTNVYGHDNLINLLGLDSDGVYEIKEVLSLYRLHNNNTSSVGNTVSNYNIDDRIEQKRKELSEYEKLLKCVNINDLHNIDTTLVIKRMKVLMKRIKCLENRNILNLIVLILFNNSYPRKTLIGDMIYIMKSKG